MNSLNIYRRRPSWASSVLGRKMCRGIIISKRKFNIWPFTSLQPTVCHSARLSIACTGCCCCRCCSGDWRAAAWEPIDNFPTGRPAGGLLARQRPLQAYRPAHCWYRASRPPVHRLPRWIRLCSASSLAPVSAFRFAKKIISIRFDSRQKIDSNRFVRIDSSAYILLHWQVCYSKGPTVE